jgi:hypothetical protein
MLFYLTDRRRNPAPKLIRPLSATFGSEDVGRGKTAASSAWEMDGVCNGSGGGSSTIPAERSGFGVQTESVMDCPFQ